MDYTLELAKRIAEALRAIPPKDPAKTRLTKQGMVTQLAEEIIGLQQRGYTIEDIVESLHDQGLEITTPTLKSYLQRTRAEKRNHSKAKQTAPRMRAKATSASSSAASQPLPNMPSSAPEAERGAIRSGKGAFLVRDKDSY